MAYVGRSPRYGFLEGQTLTFNGSTTTVTLQRNVSSTDALDVYIDNVHQEPDVAYNLASGGNQITFTGTPANGQKLYIRFHGISFDTARASKLVNTDESSSLTLTDSHTLTLDLNGTTALTATTSGITIPNLTVTGTTTSVNSTNLEVGDNQITLNSDVDGSTAPTQDAGIVINRGSSADVSFLWDEGADYWLAADPIVSSERLSVFKSGTTPSLSSSTLGVFKSTATNESAAVSIIANSGQSSTLNFGDENDEDAGKLSYNHSSELFTVDVAGSMKLDADSSNFFFSDGGTDIGLLSVNNQDVNIRNLIADKDIYFQGNDSDNGGNFTALTLDMSEGGNATFSGSVTAAGATINGNVAISNSSGDTLTLTKSTTEPSLRIEGDSGKDFVITVSGELLTFTQNDGATDIMTLDHDSGAATFTGFMGINKAAASSVALSVGADSTSTTSYGLEVTNASSNTRFLVNGVGDSLFYKTDNAVGMKFDSSSGNVGIGGTPATARLEVTGAFAYASGANSLATTVSKAAARIRGSSDASTSLFFGSITNDAEQYIQSSNGAGSGADDLVLNPYGGNVGIGASSVATNTKLHVKAGTNINFEVENSSSTLRLSALNDARSANVPMQFASSSFQFITGNVGIGAAPDTTGFGGTFQYLGVNGGSGYGIFNGQTTSTTAGHGAASFFGSTTGTSGYQLLGGMQVVNSASSSSNAEGDLVFYTATGGSLGERMRIRRGGEVDIKQNTNAVATFADNIGEVGQGNFAMQIANSAFTALKPFGIRAEDIRLATGSATRMTVNSNGNVNIGMPSGYNAEGKLHVYNGASGKSYAADSADQLILENNSSVCFDIRTPSSNNGVILFSDESARGSGQINYSHNGDTMYFYTAGNLRASLNASGLAMTQSSATDPVLTLTDAGVVDYKFTFPDTGTMQLECHATSNKTFKLLNDAGGRLDFDVEGYVYSGQGYWFNTDTDTGMYRNDTDSISFRVGGNDYFTIDGDANTYTHMFNSGSYSWYVGTSGNTFNFYDGGGTRRGYVHPGNGFVNGSDRAYKENISDITYGLETVKKLQPRKFKFKDTVDMADHSVTYVGDESVGFIAQELEQEIPELVMGEDGTKTVAYSQLTAVLVKAIQEQQALIESLTARVAELEQ